MAGSAAAGFSVFSCTAEATGKLNIIINKTNGTIQIMLGCRLPTFFEEAVADEWQQSTFGFFRWA